jgi:hypothetical protein
MWLDIRIEGESNIDNIISHTGFRVKKLNNKSVHHAFILGLFTKVKKLQHYVSPKLHDLIMATKTFVEM